MRAQILKHLVDLNVLSVNTVLSVLQALLYIYLNNCSKKVSIKAIDRWAVQVNDSSLSDTWANYRESRIPHYFFYVLFCRIERQTVKNQEYVRESPKDRMVPENQTILSFFPADPFVLNMPITKEIGSYVLSLHFYDAVKYLGELAGAWVLTCPESYIQEAYDFVKRGYKEMDISNWVKWVFGHDLEDEEKTADLHIQFALDYGLHVRLEDYDIEPDRAFQNYKPLLDG